MSYRDQMGAYPPPREHVESQYPPPPGEEEDRARAAYHNHNRAPSSSSGVTLPTISPYDPQYASPGQNGYPADPRAYQQQDPYRAPAGGPYRDDRGYPPQDYGRGASQHMAFSQSAPRQRTAIACRYCRRRKIRCSGFDQNPEGRCVNCQRFTQECIFTPVSSSAQAFVPAHSVYPGLRNMGVGPDGRARPMIYGAHGQPLGHIALPQTSPYEYPAPSPTGSYNSYNDERTPESRKRPLQEPHSSVPPPFIPGQPSYARSDSAGNRRQAIDDDLRLPPVTPNGVALSNSNYSPASSHSSTSGLQPVQQPGPSMRRTPPPRTSPGENRGDPMSLGNIMERQSEHSIDKGMLGRLGRKN